MSAEFPALRLAATVMLVRPWGGELQVLMLRRSSKSAFAPGAFVFPGGTIDAADYANAPHGWDPGRIEREFRGGTRAADAAALVRAAVREVAEEASIVLDPGDLHVFSRWVTPPAEPRRYDTYFFVTRAPSDQRGVADAFETHDEMWISPAHALERNARGDLYLVYPTVKHLERIAAFEDVDALLAFARTKPIRTIVPAETIDGGYAMAPELEERW